MARRVYTGIDVGTQNVKVVIAAPAESPEAPMHILGVGTAVAKGMRHGFVADQKEVSRSVAEALSRAASAAKIRVRRARVSMGGVGLEEIHSTADITLTASGGIVTDREVERVTRESEKRAISKLTNRVILHTIPIEFRVDNNKVFGKAVGLQGTKLSVDTLLITALAQHKDELEDAIEAAGIEVEDVMAAPLAASLVTLTKAQKTAGVALANLGAETLSVIVFDNDIPVSLKVFPTGGAAVTNAIALAFKIPLTEAEQMKRGAVTGSDIAPRRMNVIIAAQLRAMFSALNAHFKAIGRQRLLPAGLVITGGGAGLPGVVDVAKTILKLPAQVTHGHFPRASTVDPSYTVAYGLARWGYADESSFAGSSLAEIFRHIGESIKNALRALLP